MQVVRLLGLTSRCETKLTSPHRNSRFADSFAVLLDIYQRYSVSRGEIRGLNLQDRRPRRNLQTRNRRGKPAIPVTLEPGSNENPSSENLTFAIPNAGRLFRECIRRKRSANEFCAAVRTEHEGHQEAAFASAMYSFHNALLLRQRTYGLQPYYTLLITLLHPINSPSTPY